MKQHEYIALIDYGSQYTQVIARKIRGLNVLSKVYSYKEVAAVLQDPHVKGIVLSGGPQSIHDQGVRIDDWLAEVSCPILGICYGMQALASACGAEVASGTSGEYGKATIKLEPSSLWSRVPEQVDTCDVWMSHMDAVQVCPETLDVIASSEHAPIAGFAHREKPWFGLQFHPEVMHSEYGDAMIASFVLDHCQCARDWQTSLVLDEMVESISDQVGDEQVILGLSGGVDSSVLAALCHRAIGDQLTCVMVDTGLLRLNEAEEVMASIHHAMPIKIEVVDAKNRFFQALKGVDDPEEKRKICGRLFVEVFEEAASSFHGRAQWLAQGTIYPDVIESAGHGLNAAQVIKSHHNVGGLPEKHGFTLLEPLSQLFKDEVRALGLALGLPQALIDRHPFPGPGLCVRVLGEVTADKVNLIQKCDAIFLEVLRQHDLYEHSAQALAVLLPVNSVGVKGDQRVYGPVVALRSVTTEDFMTADWSRIPFDVLAEISARITNEVKEVSRVVYDITSKPPSTIEWE